MEFETKTMAQLFGIMLGSAILLGWHGYVAMARQASILILSPVVLILGPALCIQRHPSRANKKSGKTERHSRLAGHPERHSPRDTAGWQAISVQAEPRRLTTQKQASRPSNKNKSKTKVIKNGEDKEGG